MSTRTSPTHRALLLAVVSAASIASHVRALAATSAPDFPYIAYVAEPDALVRSGPGRQHYPTLQLPAGSAVEVYRHEGNGWCAIRPPEGSFSLAPVQQVQILDQRAAQAAVAGVAARVGSALGDEHAAVQVMLDRGETVALLEPPSPTSPWLRIAPPAGEFRWIAARKLSRLPPTEATPLAPSGEGWQSPSAASAAAATNVGRIGVPEPSDDPDANVGDPFAHLRSSSGAASATALAGQTNNPLWQPNSEAGAASSFAKPAPFVGDEIQIIPGSPAAVRQAQFEQAGNAAPSLPPDSTAEPNALAGDSSEDPESTNTPAPGGPPRIRFEGYQAPRKSLGPLDPRVAEMQLRLSQIVIGAPAAWQFAGLRDEATALLAQEQTPTCRDQLRDLLDRVAAFESIQARYRGLAPSAQVLATAGPGVLPADAAPNDATTAAGPTAGASEVLARVRSDLGIASEDNGITPTGAAPPATQAMYDAVGRLKPVVSRRSNAPQYALIDDQGGVVSFVTASPDVNLQAYVGRRIGVRGSRGYMPEFRRAHVTATRITPMEEKLVR